MAESMKGLHRTARCAELGESYIGKTVCMMGWVQKSRNKGGLIFTDLRDRSGILQILSDLFVKMRTELFMQFQDIFLISLHKV